MTLIVEDGTGLTDAESYVSTADLIAYATKRGITLDAAADDEAGLRAATEYVDSFGRYKASRVSSGQALQFPRTGLTDWDGHEVTGIPKRLKDAVCYLAVQAQTESLYTDQDRGGRIKSESVGPISTTFMDDAPAGKTYTVVEKLLAPYMRDPKDNRPSPFYSPSNTTFEPVDQAPYFSLGMHDGSGE